MATTPRGTGKLSTAIRDTQAQGQRNRSLRNPGLLLDEHPLGTLQQPLNGGIQPRRQTTSASVPRYG